MNNPRITAKERGLLKGAIRRVFSRSDLRREVLNSVKIDHKDPSRTVKTWYYCEHCGVPNPQHTLNVDHLEPIVPVFTTLEHMTWDELVNRVWCERSNLQVLCLTCHKEKSRIEKDERKKHKEKIK